MFEEDAMLLANKGHDYAGDKDCMDNLKEFGFFGAIVRIGDKFKRLKNFCLNQKLKVQDESVIDTLRDLRSYGYLAQILFEEEQKNQ